MKMAARIGDQPTHPMPCSLCGTPGSLDVTIGGKPAWRGVSSAVASALKAAKALADATIKAAETATRLAAGTPGAPFAYSAEQTVKGVVSAVMGQAISAGACGADVHVCATPSALPPHGPGVVINGSKTVTINGLPATRVQDEVMEAAGPPNKIQLGCFNVFIGG